MIMIMIMIMIIIIIINTIQYLRNSNHIYGVYIALYPDAQSALQHFVRDFARLLI